MTSVLLLPLPQKHDYVIYLYNLKISTLQVNVAFEISLTRKSKPKIATLPLRTYSKTHVFQTTTIPRKNTFPFFFNRKLPLKGNQGELRIFNNKYFFKNGI